MSSSTEIKKQVNTLGTLLQKKLTETNKTLEKLKFRGKDYIGNPWDNAVCALLFVFSDSEIKPLVTKLSQLKEECSNISLKNHLDSLLASAKKIASQGSEAFDLDFKTFQEMIKTFIQQCNEIQKTI